MKTINTRSRNGGVGGDGCVVAQRKVDYNNYCFEEGNSNDLNFCFWDGIYRDLEICIFQFFNVQDLLKLKRVAKRFPTLVFNTKIIQAWCCCFFCLHFCFLNYFFIIFFRVVSFV